MHMATAAASSGNRHRRSCSSTVRDMPGCTRCRRAVSRTCPPGLRNPRQPIIRRRGKLPRGPGAWSPPCEQMQSYRRTVAPIFAILMYVKIVTRQLRGPCEVRRGSAVMQSSNSAAGSGCNRRIPAGRTGSCYQHRPVLQARLALATGRRCLPVAHKSRQWHMG
jgi:hypothetical protein